MPPARNPLPEDPGPPNPPVPARSGPDTWHPATVTLLGMLGPYDALVRLENPYSYATPRLPRAAVYQLADHWRAFSTDFAAVFDQDTLAVTYPGTEQPRTVRIEPNPDATWTLDFLGSLPWKIEQAPWPDHDRILAHVTTDPHLADLTRAVPDWPDSQTACGEEFDTAVDERVRAALMLGHGLLDAGVPIGWIRTVTSLLTGHRRFPTFPNSEQS